MYHLTFSSNVTCQRLMWLTASGKGQSIGMGRVRIGMHTLQNVRMGHCCGCLYLKLAVSWHIQQLGKVETYIYPEPVIKCVLEWKPPVYHQLEWSGEKEKYLA